MNENRSIDNATPLGILIAAFVPLLLLIPFLDKAFHLDDPMFIWVAEQILRDPLDFYGLEVNWAYADLPMHEINQNPPLVSYFIASVIHIFGISEIALHTAFLAPAIALSMGTYRLACLFCNSPIFATLIATITPIFVVSASNVMAETTMSAFYVWAIYFWVTGLSSGEHSRLVISGVMAALSICSKYFGISLVPLLFVYSLTVTGKPRKWWLSLLIPVLTVTGYQWLTSELYGSNLIKQAVEYSINSSTGNQHQWSRKLLICLMFLGGCYISKLFFWHEIWKRKTIAICALGIGLLTLVVQSNHAMFATVTGINTPQQPVVILQMVLFLFLGLQIAFLAFRDTIKARDSSTVILCLWLSGTIIFATVINWTVNARVLLPALPAVGIIIARAIERASGSSSISRWRQVIAFIPAAMISLWVTYSDYSWANNQKSLAHEVASKHAAPMGSIWFDGHWGFQWYMEQAGFKLLDLGQPVNEGDIVIQPQNNSNLRDLDFPGLTQVHEIRLPICCSVRTMSSKARAGFYSDLWGELPYAFAAPEMDRYRIYIVGNFKSGLEAEIAYAKRYKFGDNLP